MLTVKSYIKLLPSTINNFPQQKPFVKSSPVSSLLPANIFKMRQSNIFIFQYCIYYLNHIGKFIDIVILEVFLQFFTKLFIQIFFVGFMACTTVLAPVTT